MCRIAICLTIILCSPTLFAQVLKPYPVALLEKCHNKNFISVKDSVLEESHYANFEMERCGIEFYKFFVDSLNKSIVIIGRFSFDNKQPMARGMDAKIYKAIRVKDTLKYLKEITRTPTDTSERAFGYDTRGFFLITTYLNKDESIYFIPTWFSPYIEEYNLSDLLINTLGIKLKDRNKKGRNPK